MTEEEWEKICDGCGKCCSFANAPIACPSLDCSTNRCMNYANRLETESCCMKVSPSNVLLLHQEGALPDSCAYVRFAYGLDPLPRPVEPARLIPFILAPLEMQKKYQQANEKWKNRS